MCIYSVFHSLDPMPSENLYKKYSQRSYDMEGCRDTSFRVVGFGQYSLNSLVFMMSDVMQSGHILSFLLPLIQEGQLSVTGESMCTKV